VRVGIGYDIHKFGGERPLVSGGVVFPGERGLVGHSDADVLLHAIIDAIFGAAGLGDIGQHFPDDDPEYAGAASTDLLRECVAMAGERGLAVESVDSTVIAESPRLAPHIAALRETIAGIVGVAADRVNVKGKTNEGVGEIGLGEAIAAMAVVVLGEGG
jgi:2-C-methyl-D-erythritol 2,4-cyclodiphosphate synthase